MKLKETLELLASVKLLSVAAVEIGKDGLGAEDVSKALELLKKVGVLVEGFKGLDMVDDELKELDQAELIELGTAGYDLVKSVMVAVKKESFEKDEVF